MNVYQTARLRTGSKKHVLFALILSAAAYGVWQIKGDSELLFLVLFGVAILGVFFERWVSAFIARNEHQLFIFELKHMLANEERILLMHMAKFVVSAQKLIPSEDGRRITEALWQTGNKSYRWDIIVRTMQSSVYVLRKQADILRTEDATRAACRHQLREKRKFLSHIKSRKGELTKRRQHLEASVHTLKVAIASSRQVLLATRKMLDEMGEIA